jgi:hypothetical protein
LIFKLKVIDPFLILSIKSLEFAVVHLQNVNSSRRHKNLKNYNNDFSIIKKMNSSFEIELRSEEKASINRRNQRWQHFSMYRTQTSLQPQKNQIHSF